MQLRSKLVPYLQIFQFRIMSPRVSLQHTFCRGFKIQLFWISSCFWVSWGRRKGNSALTLFLNPSKKKHRILKFQDKLCQNVKNSSVPSKITDLNTIGSIQKILGPMPHESVPFNFRKSQLHRLSHSVFLEEEIKPSITLLLVCLNPRLLYQGSYRLFVTYEKPCNGSFKVVHLQYLRKRRRHRTCTPYLWTGEREEQWISTQVHFNSFSIFYTICRIFIALATKLN